METHTVLAAPTAPTDGAPQGELPEATSNPFIGRLTREQVVDRIIQINPTASIEFLAAFDDLPLRRYLDRLADLSGQRGRSAVWVRPADQHAICAPTPA